MQSLAKSSTSFTRKNAEDGRVTSAAKTGFTRLFRHAVEEGLHQEVEGWSIPLGEPDLWQQCSHLMMSCLCTFDFRAFITVHFNHDKVTHQYVSDIIGHSRGRETISQLVNGFFLERTNVISGFLKRELTNQYLHLGVSAPDILSRNAIKHHQHLHHSFNIFLAASHLGSGINFPCGFYLSPFGVLDYAYAEQSNTEKVETGSFEFF